MTKVYEDKKNIIEYCTIYKRAEVSTKKFGYSRKFAMIHMPVNNKSCFEKIKSFLLIKCTRSWITVKDEKGNKTDQLVNIKSIASRIGLTRSEIIASNNQGILYSSISTRASAIWHQINLTQLSAMKVNKIKDDQKIDALDKIVQAKELKRCHFVLYFDPVSKSTEFKCDGNSSYDNSINVGDYYKVGASIYKENGEYYIDTFEIEGPKDGIKGRKKCSSKTCNAIRNEVLNLYTT